MAQVNDVARHTQSRDKSSGASFDQKFDIALQ